MSFADCSLEHVFDIEVLFGEDRTVFGPLPGGGRQGYTPAIGGTITGPRLTGSVVPHSGADYAAVREDGVIELNAHYLLKASDGTLIYIINKDVPGVVGKVGTLLGDREINIAEYNLARSGSGGKAMAIITVDSRLDDETLNFLRSYREMVEVRQVQL